jgi:hypothetical protein
MGLIQNNLEDLGKIRNRFRSGKLNIEGLNAELSIYAREEQQMKMYLQGISMIAKHGKIIKNQLERSNFLTDSAIDCTQIGDEEDKIKCEQTNDIMTRQECLDKSGEEDSCCGGCETGLINKRILCGAK